MKIPPPGSLRLLKEDLLRGVARRLAERYPQLADSLSDPVDPGWILLEQAAWMIETLSGKLDQYPRNAIQHFLHLTGHQLRAAQPAVGVATAEVLHAGHLPMSEGEMPGARFFTSGTAISDALEFALVEPDGVPLVPGLIQAVYRLQESGELVRTFSQPLRPRFPATHEVMLQPHERLDAFRAQEIRFLFPRTLFERLAPLVDRYNADSPGWMYLSIFETGSAHDLGVNWLVGIPVESRGEFVEADESGRQSLSFPWRELPFHLMAHDRRDRLEYRPEVKLTPEAIERGARLSMEASFLRIQMVGGGTWLRDRRLYELVTLTRPVPARVADQFYHTLLIATTDWDESRVTSTSARFPIRHRIVPAVARAVPWLEAAVQDRRWDPLFMGESADVIELRFYGRLSPGQPLRFGLLFPWMDDELPETSLQLYPLRMEGGGMRLLEHSAPPVGPMPLWRFSWPSLETMNSSRTPPDSSGEGPHGGPLELSVYEVRLPDDAEVSGLLVVVPSVPGRPLQGAMVNPMLVANCPMVMDGRAHRISGAIQEAISLLYRDIVTRETLERLAGQAVSPEVGALLRRLCVSRLRLLRDGTAILDWQGMELDPSEGALTFSTASRDIRLMDLRRGDLLQLTWYRRTDGARGNLPPGALNLVEQAPTASTRIRAIHNLMPTILGRDREDVDSGVSRIFGPPVPLIPVTPSDFEQWTRAQLVDMPHPWIVRCWSEAERSLLSCDWWYVPGAMPAEVSSAVRDLEAAGPKALLLVLGVASAPGGGPDFAAAVKQLRRAWKRIADRLPHLETLVVAPFVPLTHYAHRAGLVKTSAHSPRFDLKGLEGSLADDRHSRAVPRHLWYFLNAAVVSSRPAGEEP